MRILVRMFCLLSLLLPLRQAEAQQVRLAPTTSRFRYRRPLTLPPVISAGIPPARACATLDAAVYAHAEPSLSDVRLFAASPIGPQERPYALTSSQTQPTADTARMLNLGLSHGHLSFDLEMPARAYSEVDLQLDARDFVATATVSGRHALTAADHAVSLGSFTVFDLTSQHLGRSTVLPLVESTFTYLHIELSFSGADGKAFAVDPLLIQGAFIPPSREAQILYTTVAETAMITQRGKQTIATLTLPAKVPVEQIEFVLAAGDKTNFSRMVSVHVLGRKPSASEAGPSQDAPQEQFSGEIAHVHMTSAGREVRLDELHVPATVGLNVKDPVTVEVAINNGDDQPVPVIGVRLQMRQRRICFNVPEDPVTMFYGADALDAPIYDFSRLFNPAEPVREATLGAELKNAAYKPPPAVVKPFTERHPEVLWIALIVAILSLGAVALRSAKRL